MNIDRYLHFAENSFNGLEFTFKDIKDLMTILNEEYNVGYFIENYEHAVKEFNYEYEQLEIRLREIRDKLEKEIF